MAGSVAVRGAGWSGLRRWRRGVVAPRRGRTVSITICQTRAVPP